MATTDPLSRWAASDPEAMDELLSGNSFWPQFCCALSCPFFMLARVVARAKLLDFDTALGMGILVFVALVVGGTLVESTSPALAALGGVMQESYVLLIVLATMLVRRKLRQRHGIPGSGVMDCIASCYPCSVWGLTVLDRQLAVAQAPPPAGVALGAGDGATAPAAPRPAASGGWTTGLFSLSSDGAPVLYCACIAPWFVQARVLIRLGVEQRTAVTVGVFVLWAASWSLGGSSGGHDSGSGGGRKTGSSVNSGVTGALAFLTALCGVSHLAVTLWLRRRVRSRYGIDGTLAKDAGAALCCGPCVLAQMERQTQELSAPALQAWVAKHARPGDAWHAAGVPLSSRSEELPPALPPAPPAPVYAYPQAAPVNAYPQAAPVNAYPQAAPVNAYPQAAPVNAYTQAAPPVVTYAQPPVTAAATVAGGMGAAPAPMVGGGPGGDV